MPKQQGFCAMQELRKKLQEQRQAADAARAQAQEAEARLSQHQSAAAQVADSALAQVRALMQCMLSTYTSAA